MMDSAALILHVMSDRRFAPHRYLPIVFASPPICFVWRYVFRPAHLSLVIATLCSGCAAVSGFPKDPEILNHPGGSARTIPNAEVDAIRRVHGTSADRMGMARVAYRNSFVYSEIAAVDDSFDTFLRKVRTQRATLNIVASGAVLALNGLAATTGGTKVKAALAAVSAGLVGQKETIDKELFDAEALAALIARMRAARLAALVPIRIGLTQNLAAYPLEAAIVDVHAYRAAGNLLSAVDAVVVDAGAVSDDAQHRISNVLRDSVYRDSRSSISTISTAVAKLTDAQTLHVMALMQGRIASRAKDLQDDLAAENPSMSHLRDASAARQFLLYWLEQEEGTTGEIEEWHQALQSVE